jgi:hypothetical protein
MTTHERGEIVWYPAVFADYDRPFLLYRRTERLIGFTGATSVKIYQSLCPTV